MKVATILAYVGLSSAHAIFQQVSVNGADQGLLYGVRATYVNNPIENVNDAAFACNKNLEAKDNNIISIPAGARVGARYQHLVGGPQGSNDPDNPIAASHKGPIMVYLAKVSNAATTGTTGLQWFKVAEDGLTGSTWAVDRLIANNGWHYFDMPTCVAPGDYLMRVELLALHSASTQGAAQFYMGCAQIRVSGSGSNTGAGNTVSFPGAYSATDPGILVSIYDQTGQPTNGGRSYAIPGPRPITCSGGGQTPPQTTLSTSTRPTPTSGAGAPLYGQCGGIGWNGATTCAEGTCTKSGDYYSQCLP
ncbi:related to endoglucanase B [Cephalotrichum gorgonifer]|uniref:lytic cellulose monooxygenase (C4-dehydrogenating) n=1 Tax=Cephalotrichum gorgonifer TaxID=2041049 RepID=A0AAE8N6N6_9PEZI|nr:related to endoglucanase B [Cephalotrichum gorgonifer]